MKCQQCGTAQVQRIRDGLWRTLCRCRKCKRLWYDGLTAEEYNTKLLVRQMLDPPANLLCEIDLGAIIK